MSQAAQPQEAPKALKVLGILALCFSILGLALSLFSTAATVANIADFAHAVGLSPDTYNLWILIMGAVALMLCVLELLAGIGMTLRRRWGRTLGLIFAFAALPLNTLMWIGFYVVNGMLQYDADHAGGHAFGGPMFVESKMYNGNTCLGPIFAILLLCMLFTGPMRRWAKAGRDARQGQMPSPAPLDPLAYAPTAPAAAEAAPVAGGAAPVPAAALASGQLPTHDARLPLGFGEAPRAGGPMTLHAAAPLAFAATAATPPALGVPLPAPGAPVAAAAPDVTAPFAPVTEPTYVAEESRLCKAALFSFLVALCPIIPVIGQITALILGNMAFKRIARSNGALHGRGLAIAGVIISGCQLVLILLILTLVLIFSLQKN